MNDIPIVVFRVEENGEEVYPLYYTKKKRRKRVNKSTRICCIKKVCHQKDPKS